MEELYVRALSRWLFNFYPSQQENSVLGTTEQRIANSGRQVIIAMFAYHSGKPIGHVWHEQNGTF